MLRLYGVLLGIYTQVMMKEFKIKILDVNYDTALEEILNIHPKTYERKDVINRGTKRVYVMSWKSDLYKQ